MIHAQTLDTDGTPEGGRTIVTTQDTKPPLVLMPDTIQAQPVRK